MIENVKKNFLLNKKAPAGAVARRFYPLILP